jgi:GT2 family glycosyltransferase
VIATGQRRDPVERLLDALGCQTLPAGDFEVIVIVDGSTDGTCEMLANRTAPYVLRWLEQRNQGRASACNGGVAVAGGDLVVLLDDDMEPAPGCLEAHARAHVPGSRRAVMGAAPIVIPDDAPAHVGYVGRKFNRHLDSLARPGRSFALRDFYSGNLSIPRSLLMEVGGFDADFTAYGNEHLELCCRLRRHGVDIAFSSAAGARQHYTKDVAALARDHLAKGRTARRETSRHGTGTEARGMFPGQLDAPYRAARSGWTRNCAAGASDVRDGVYGHRRLAAHTGPRPCVHRGNRLPLLRRRAQRDARRCTAARCAMTDTVVHVTDRTQFGGAEQVILQLLEGLDRRRWQCVLFHQPAAAASALVSRADSLGVREYSSESLLSWGYRTRPWPSLPNISDRRGSSIRGKFVVTRGLSLSS